MSSIFDRINAQAAVNKQAAWAAYSPLTQEQLGKETHTHDMASEREIDETVVVHRPTEVDAIKHALGWYRFMSEDVVIRLEPVAVEMRWCILCEKCHPLDAFATDRRTPSGLSFGCRRGRADMARSPFRIATKRLAVISAIAS